MASSAFPQTFPTNMRVGVIFCLIGRPPMTMICHDSPYLSCSQPSRSLNGYRPSPTSAEPPFSSTFHNSSASPLVRQATRNDTAGVNLNSGPADRRVNSCPARYADCKVVASSCHLWQVMAMKWQDLLTLLDGAT